MGRVLTAAQFDAVIQAGRVGGLDHVGACRTHAWTSTRSTLSSRRAQGLAADMQFTYRNPARSTEPGRVMRDASTLFVGARNYAQQVVDDRDLIKNDIGARVARYATADHYGRLESGLRSMADALRSLGCRSVVVIDKNDLVDREAAWRAGIGWYGKNSLMLAPGAGSWFVLGSVVTDAVVRHVPQPISDGCGSCAKCIDACPTGAIVAPGSVDARRCLSWLLQASGSFPIEFRQALGNRIYGCDDCQEVCPPNRTVELRSRRGDPWPIEHDPGSWIGASELLELSDDDLLERCRRWYIQQRDPSIVRRNLLIVLANVLAAGQNLAEQPGPRVTEAARERAIALIERYRDVDDPVLQETACWASDQLASSHLASSQLASSHLASRTIGDEDGRP